MIPRISAGKLLKKLGLQSISSSLVIGCDPGRAEVTVQSGRRGFQNQLTITATVQVTLNFILHTG
jgi:hypothetical protein